MRNQSISLVAVMIQLGGFLAAPPVPASPGSAATAEAANQAAAVLAGVEPPKRERITRSTAWKSHSAAMQKEWTRYEESTLMPMRRWAATEVAPYCAGQRVVRYLFSGPDVLHVLRIFPDAETYILGGLEPIGAVPDLDDIRRNAAARALAEVRKSLEESIRFSFFKTKDMKVDLANATFPGTLPIMCLFLAQSGHSISEIEFLRLNKDGTLDSLGDHPSGAAAVKVTARPDSGRSKTIIYFRTNVADGSIEQSGFLTYLQSQPRGTAYLKAASYLLHNPYFSKVRDHLIESSHVIVQDDSGIPLRHFDRSRWTVGLYGRYTRPIDLFKDDYQADLYRSYRSGGAKALPFGTGYRWRKSDSNLLVAVRGKPDQGEVASAVPKAHPISSKPADPAPARRGAGPLTGAAAPPGGAIVLRLELLKPSVIDDLGTIRGRSALGLFEYKVLSVESGSYPGDRIRIAHGVFWNGRPTAMAGRTRGWLASLELVPFASYPSLSRLPLENDLAPAPDLPVYVPKLD